MSDTIKKVAEAIEDAYYRRNPGLTAQETAARAVIRMLADAGWIVAGPELDHALAQLGAAKAALAEAHAEVERLRSPPRIVQSLIDGVNQGHAATLHSAIDRLAGLFEYGNLLASTQPEVFIAEAADEIEKLRDEVGLLRRERGAIREHLGDSLRSSCSCCRRCGTTVPCDSLFVGKPCEGLCFCGVQE